MLGPYLEPILKKDVEVVKLKKQDPEKAVRKDYLSVAARKHLRDAKNVLETVTGEKIRQLRVVEFIKKPETCVCYQFRGTGEGQKAGAGTQR